MRKALMWIGLLAFVSGAVLVFLSGSSSGATKEPTVPALYGTNQTLWTALAVIGIVLFVVSLFLRKK